MNTLKHILIILLAAVLVSGATLAVAEWSGQSSTGETDSASAERPDFESGTAPTRPEGGEDEASGLMGLADVGKNAVIFSVLFGAVMVVNLIFNWINKRWLHQPAPKAQAG